ncbi:MAG: signal peptidase [Bacteroidetes bacterium]|nr:signal peptidase [Bacteroidota bacterium]
MKNISNKLILSLLAVVFCVDFYKAPPPPPGGGGGPTTPGAPSSPIDMYLLVLGIIALTLVFLYSKKVKTNKI